LCVNIGEPVTLLNDASARVQQALDLRPVPSEAPGFHQAAIETPETGKHLLRQYGCINCHTIPQIGSAYVGPPLTAFAERQYIAGSIVNLPTNTLNWIMDPKKY